MTLFGLFSREDKKSLDAGLKKTRESFLSQLGRAIAGKSKIDDYVLDELEEILIASDVGTATTLKIIDRIQKKVARDKYLNTSELNDILRDEIVQLLTENKSVGEHAFELIEGKRPYIMLIVGVNGAGKTTTIGKLAAQFKKTGKTVVLGAADTFRAAAVDQLKLWGQRAGVTVIDQGMGADPGAVAYETVKYGVGQNTDLVIIDTAGRLHTKVNLMNELAKIRKVIAKVIPDAPHEVLLVLDGSTGQNAFHQAREFIKATDVNSLVITKLDGTAKGGVVIGISDEFGIPVRFIGVGEMIEDLQVFNRREFVDSLFTHH